MQKNGLIRKIRLASKLITSQTGKKAIAIHILSNISSCKCNQTKKYGPLIEYNIRNTFVEIIHKMGWRNYSETLF